MTPRGKIARLPRAVRDELNRRLADGEPGQRLLNWLNNHQDVRSVLAADFDHRPINHVNLSAWRRGAFRTWQSRRELLEEVQATARQSAKLAKACGPIVDHVAALLSARLAATLTEWDGDPASPVVARLRLLSSLRQDIVALRRADQSAIRVYMEKERFDTERREAQERLAEKRRETEEYQARLKDPKYLRERREFVDRMMGRTSSASDD
jgi:hypothetical protein